MDIRKATRSQKIIAKQQFSMLRKLGNGRRRSADDLLDSWRETLRKIMRDY